jgi:hypothetical protein
MLASVPVPPGPELLVLGLVLAQLGEAPSVLALRVQVRCVPASG